jgi:hypothetical protein
MIIDLRPDLWENIRSLNARSLSDANIAASLQIFKRRRKSGYPANANSHCLSLSSSQN